jgi:predicted ATP-dependent endonuclease of OLD family
MRINRLIIESFRGIPGKLELDFTGKNNLPCSVLIFGDNGSGKSSIIDALEFNLQGKIERSESLKNEFRPSPFNLNSDGQRAKTVCFFDDSSKNERDLFISYDPDKEKNVVSKSANGLHPNYKVAPIALRRSDIISYSSTPTERKQILFWSFIYNKASDNLEEGYDKSLINSFENERIEIKKKKKTIREELADICKIPLEETPNSKIEVDSFVKDRILKGLRYKDYQSLKSRGMITRVNEKALAKANQLNKLNDELSEIQSKISRLKNVDSDSSSIRKAETRRFLEEASNNLTESFKLISTVDFVHQINVKISELTEVSFEIEIILKNGKSISPNNIFSEANLDLLILLLYTSIIREAEKYGQAKILILDDVLQSVDSIIRVKFIEYLLANFKDWQIIITAHDRLWLNQIKTAFNRHSHIFKELEIFRWNFESGPQIFEGKGQAMVSAFNDALESKNPQLIASQAGLFMEGICHNLSIQWSTSVKRKEGDRYTLGDLWGGIMKSLKNTDLKGTD